MKVLIVFVVAALVACVCGLDSDSQAVTLKRDQNVRPDGYVYSYETSNGIAAQEQGGLLNDALSVQGSAQWTDPQGEPVQLSYVADENGYHPTGSHVPEVPEYILRAVEYIRTHPPPPAKR